MIDLVNFIFFLSFLPLFNIYFIMSKANCYKTEDCKESYCVEREDKLYSANSYPVNNGHVGTQEDDINNQQTCKS